MMSIAVKATPKQPAHPHPGSTFLAAVATSRFSHGAPSVSDVFESNPVVTASSSPSKGSWSLSIVGMFVGLPVGTLCRRRHQRVRHAQMSVVSQGRMAGEEAVETVQEQILHIYAHWSERAAEHLEDFDIENGYDEQRKHHAKMQCMDDMEMLGTELVRERNINGSSVVSDVVEYEYMGPRRFHKDVDRQDNDTLGTALIEDTL